MDLQYPGKENKSVVLPSSDIDQTSSPPPPPSPNAVPICFSDSDFAETIPPPPFEHYSGDEGSVPAASIDVHPLINGMYVNYVIL